MSEQDVLNDVMQMLEAAPDSSKPSDFPVSLPANNVPELCQKLAVLVSTGKTKEALGVQVFLEQVKCLTDKEVEAFYKRYEAYVSSKTTKTLIQSFLTLASKAISMVVKVNDVQASKKDLQKEFVINSMLSSVAGNIALHCGCLLPVANAALITANNIDFEKEPEQEPCKEADKQPAKTFTLLYILSDNKLVKTVLNAAMHTGLTAGIGWVAKKAVKKTLQLTPTAMS